MYDVFVHTTRDAKSQPAYLLEYCPLSPNSVESGVPELLQMLKRHVLRSKVRIRDVTMEHDVWAAWGNSHSWDSPVRQWSWARSGVAEPVWEAKEWPWGSEDMLIRDRRAPGMGTRRLVRRGEKRESFVCRVIGRMHM